MKKNKNIIDLILGISLFVLLALFVTMGILFFICDREYFELTGSILGWLSLCIILFILALIEISFCKKE